MNQQNSIQRAIKLKIETFIVRRLHGQLVHNTEPSLDINTQLSELIISLENKKQDLIDLKQTYKLNNKFCIGIRIEQNQSPSIYLNNNTISFANDIQAEFDIDLYNF